MRTIWLRGRSLKRARRQGLERARRHPDITPWSKACVRRLPRLDISVVVFAAFLALLGLALFRSGGEPGSLGVNKDFGEVSIEEKPAPDFTLELLQGGSVSLGDLKGRVVLVDFWASWCPPCIEEAPILNSVYEEYRERGVEFLGVCIWDTTKGCEQFLQEFDLAYPSGRDSEGAILVDYGVKGIPEKFFIDAQGRVARKFAGPIRDEDILRNILDEMLADSG